MTDAEWVLAALAAFTAAGGPVWLRRGEVAVAGGLAGRAVRPEAGAWVRNDHGGLVPGPATPAGFAVVGAPWPVAVSPDGVAAGGRVVRFADVSDVRADGAAVGVNGRLLAKCRSSADAGRWAARLLALRALPAADRAARLAAELADHCDPAAAAAAVARARAATAGLRRWAAAAFVWAFGGAAAWAAGVAPVPPGWLAAGYAGLAVAAVAAYARAARSLGADAPPAWPLLLSPADLFHAAGRLVRAAANGFHPAAVAAGVGGPGADPAVRRLRLAARHRPSAADPVTAWHEAAVAAALDVAFAGRPLPPPAREGAAAAYCPRCEAQFDRGAGCPDCGLPLVPFHPRRMSGNS